jgi:pyroglutamyl-peptidase
MSVLVLGFEPFLDFDENPTELVVKDLDGKIIEGERVTGVVLPVDYDLVESKILGAIERTKPKLVIGFGLAQKRERITPEKIAVNYRLADEPDNAGRKMGGVRIDGSEPDGIFSSLPVESLVSSLNSVGIPASVSLSAGAYLCNDAMFVIVREAARRGFSGGFVHVPCHSEWVSRKNRQLPSLPLAMIAKAAEHSTAYCLRSLATRKF